MSEASHFQFYGTFEKIISYLPDNEQLKFYKAFVRYGLYGEEPDFDGKDMAIFCQVKFAIDNQKTKSGALAENGRKGGKCAKQTEANESKSKQSQANASKAKQTEANESKNAEMNRNEFELELEHEHEIPPEADSACEDSDEAIANGSPPDDYARRVFDLCAKIGIPNCNNNFISFIQRDFRLALQGIHELRLHSDEFFGALENYGEVLKLKREGRTWWERELTLDQLCCGQKKLIMRFLPGNYKVGDYLKEIPPEEERRRKREAEKAEEERLRAEKYKDAPKKCPKCHRPIYPNNDMVACMQCHVWYEKTEGGWELHGHSP